MRILHVLWSGQIGGIERVVYDLSRAQLSMGLEPAWLLGQAGGFFHSQALQASIPVQSLGLRSGLDLSPTKWRNALRAMRGASLLHFHGFHPIMAGLAKTSRLPIVYSIHGGFQLGRKKRPYEFLREIARRQFIRGAASVTANSAFTARSAAERYGLPLSRVRVVPNGVDVEETQILGDGQRFRVENGIPSDVFCVGSACRLVSFKRVDRLIRAFSMLLKSCPRSMLIIAGDGPDLPFLESQVRDLEMSGKVRFVGSRTDMNNFYAALDAFVVPSYGEAFGMVALEAGACGLPVLAFADGGGVVEIIQQMDQKMIVGDEDQLAVRLSSLSSDPEMRKAVGARAKAVATSFNIKKMAGEIQSIYEIVMGSCSANEKDARKPVCSH